MDYPVQPLYRLLQYWHFCSILNRLIATALMRIEESPKTPNEELYIKALSHHSEFEKALLDIHTKGFDWQRFIGVDNRQQSDWYEKKPAEVDLYWTVSSIPGMIASWTLHSRRVYTMPEDLQLLLACTSLEGVDWSKVRLPFGSFLLNLPIPLEDPDGTLYDSMLITRDYPKWIPGSDDDGNPLTSVTIIPAQLQSANTDLPIAKRQKLAKLAEKGDPAGAFYTLQDLLISKQHRPRTKLIFRPEMFEDPANIENLEKAQGSGVNSFTGAEFPAVARRLTKAIGRIFFGFLLYLQSAPAHLIRSDVLETHGTEKIPGQARVVADETKVCHIQSVYHLKPAEREIFRNVMLGKSGYEVSPHHREGHWRRPPGQGDDPTAEKTVWVRPTIVRKDKLHEGELPGGAEKVA